MPLTCNSSKILLKHTSLSMTLSAENIPVTSTTTNDFLHNSTATTFRKIYSFVISCRITNSIVIDRLQNIAEFYRSCAHRLIKFSAKVWSSNYLFPFGKNAICRLAFKCIKDKQSRWLNGIEFSPTCSYCDEELETTQHFLFECKKLENFRSFLALNMLD